MQTKPLISIVLGLGGLTACGGSDDPHAKPIGDAGTDVVIPPDAGGVVCGNGIVETGEQCDDGPGNGSGGGCDKSCNAACSSAADCDDGEACNGVETCQPAGTGRACVAGAPPSDGSACGSSGYCKNGVCTVPVCGNGELEPGEGCEPPSSGACSASCALCGDGVIGKGEDCDDGGLESLDGCDPSCHYETFMRFSWFEYMTVTGPPFCVHPANAFGTALSIEIATQLSQGLNTATDGGLNNMFLGFGGLDDVTGTNDSAVQLAMLNGSVDPRFAWKPGSIDAWFLAASSSIDGQGKPTGLFGAGSIKNRVLSVGPGDFAVQSVFNITPYDLYSRDTTIKATIDAIPAPDVPLAPPAALAPGLKVFQSVSAMGSDEGLCAALTVGSLAQGNIPQDLALGQYACSASCSDSHAYTYCGAGQPVGPTCNSFLDLLVGGCKVSALCVPAIKPTQPDVGSNGNAPAPIVLGANNKAILSTPTDAYSIYMHFKATRAHFTNNLP